MNGREGVAGEVLRGMHIEAVPLRLQRPRMAQALAAGAEPQPPAELQALQQGYEEGLRQGRAEGLSTGHAEGVRRGEAEAAQRARLALEQAIATAVAPLQQERARCRDLLAALGAAGQDCLAAAEDDMVALCFEAVCRLLGAAAAQPELLRQQLRALAGTRAASGAVTLHLHPQDAALLDGDATTGQEAASAGELRYVADPQVTLGGCIVVGAGGGLDLRLETALATFKDTLLEVRAARAEAAGARP